VSSREVTDGDEQRRGVEAELRAELLDLVHDAVIVREPAESRVTFWNRGAEAMYGYSSAEAVGRVTHELLATVFPESREAVDDALGRDGVWDGELHHTRKDGAVIIVTSRQALERDEDGPPLAIIELNSDVTDRRRAGQEIRTLNTELEQRVAARTADLEGVNRELETFAYSVSHDLRAPLRAIDGFSKALLDDYGEQLDEQARHYLGRVRAGALRMGNLIDEILQLSRLSRQQFERVQVDLSAVATEVAQELSDAEPERGVKVEIQDGVLAEADPALAESVLQNLFANAYKFTSKTKCPNVRFGMSEENGVPVYFVADNGAGFDMARADRLFQPFGRLHGESEFPGNGIGLATVLRAVHRHGGVVWAEGAVDHGATFHFSLGPGASPPVSSATGEDAVPIWQPRD
jgi:PAS domain S-box-containing protein